MRYVVAAVAWLMAWALVVPPTWAQDGDTADLSVTVQWGGPGVPHLKTGDTATWTVTVTNTGPSTAREVEVGAGGSDQFRRFASSCGEGSSCDLGDLPVGASRSVVFSAQGCLVQTYRERVWWVTSTASSSTPDPNTSDNGVSVDVRITGRLGACS